MALPKKIKQLEPLPSLGGLLAIGGPPFGGKQLLAAHLSERIPNVVKIETLDDLNEAEEVWKPQTLHNQKIIKPVPVILASLRRLWSKGAISRLHTIILSARFSTPKERLRAHEFAQDLDIPFLFVESLSSNIRTMRRISSIPIQQKEILKRLQRFENALNRYELIGEKEAKSFSTLRLKNVLSHLEDSVKEVLTFWWKIS
jgi:hypothetical protein